MNEPVFHFRGGQEAIEKEIRRLAGEHKSTHEVGDKVHELVEKGADYARQISPVKTGAFKDSWEVKDLKPKKDGDTPGAQLFNTDPGAVSIEYGTSHAPAHGTLAAARQHIERLAEQDDHHVDEPPHRETKATPAKRAPSQSTHLERPSK